MKNLSSKFKILSYFGLLLIFPMLSIANEEATTTSAIVTKSVLETTQTDEKKEEIRKQLKDTIDLGAALVSKFQNLEDRMMDRVAVIEALGNLSKDTENKLDIKKRKLDEALASADGRVNSSLVKLAESVLNATKPAKPVAAFKKEVNNMKAEIMAAHKIIIEMIGLIKKEIAKFDIKSDKESPNSEATSTEQAPN